MELDRDGLQDSYSIAVDRGYAVLSRMAHPEQAWPPPNTGNINEEIMLDSVYGGSIDPESPGEYLVYSIDWVDEIPAERPIDPEQAPDISPQVSRAIGEPTEAFTRHLDDYFKGWIYHRGRQELYVLAPDQDELPPDLE